MAQESEKYFAKTTDGGLEVLKQAIGGLLPLHSVYALENQPFATGREVAADTRMEALAGLCRATRLENPLRFPVLVALVD